jgi:hypothetical protein
MHVVTSEEPDGINEVQEVLVSFKVFLMHYAWNWIA